MDQRTINEIIAYLKEALSNNKVQITAIAVFGSAMSGQMHPDSDVDIIVVSDDFRNKDIFERSDLTMTAEIDTMKMFKVPMDILNLTPEEYEDSKTNRFYQSRIVA